LNHHESDWPARYGAKIATPEQAVRLIPPRKRIAIAHPDFRADLFAAAKKRCYVFPGAP
jgi:hypothetical protein